MIKNNFSPDQLSAYQKLISGRSVFLSGRAGTGKSYVVNAFMESNITKNIVILGTTGIAAMNVKGQTIHSFFRLPVGGILNEDKCRYLKMDIRCLFEAVDVVVIDEVSMLRADVMDAIEWTLRKNNCSGLRYKQLVLVGDKKQLPPVVTDDELEDFEEIYGEDNFFFDSSFIFKSLDIECIELETVHRQSDPEFIAGLNIVRDGGKDEYFRQFVSKEKCGIVLAPHLSTVRHYNTTELSKLSGDEMMFCAQVSGTANIKDFNVEKKLVLRSGARVMHTMNNRDRGLVNGTMGTIELAKDGNSFDIYFIPDGEDIKWPISLHIFEKVEYQYSEDEDKIVPVVVGTVLQYPLKLAWAITIHKSQGLTFDECTLDLSRSCFEKGQLYTALSRVRGPEGLKIIL